MRETTRRAMRHAKRARQVPKGGACACGMPLPEALHPIQGGHECYECGLRRRGRSTMESHHILGRAVHAATVPLPGNLHRLVSDMQTDTPNDLHDASPADPLALFQLVLRAGRDFLKALLQFVERGIEWLYRFWKALREKHGSEWWTEYGLPGFWGPA